MPAVIYVHDERGLWLEVPVLRCRRYMINGIETYECLVRVDGKLKYAFKSI